MKAAADGIKGVSLELGGKSPIVVLDDADLGLAVGLVMGGIFFNAGQMCSATSRLLLSQHIADAFLRRLKEAAENLIVGDPLDPATHMGPLVSQAQYDRVMAYLQHARDTGLQCLSGGARQPGQAKGFFVAPTIFTKVPSDSRLWREEIFGPVLCVHEFSTDEEAVALANDSEYGLVATVATVVSGNPARAKHIAGQLEVGLVWINAPQVIFPQTSWGGMKKSSLGRELGPWGLAAFQQTKHVVSA